MSQGKRKKIKECITDIATELGMVIPNLEETRSRRDYNKYILQYESVIEGSGLIVLPQFEGNDLREQIMIFLLP